MAKRKLKKPLIDLKRYVPIFGEINQDTIGAAMKRISEIIERDKTNRKNGGPIWLGISSDGGDEFYVVALMEFLRVHNIEVNTMGYGNVNSAAIFLLCLGKFRFATKQCFLIVHEGYIEKPTGQQLHVQRRFIPYAKRSTDIMIRMIARRTGKPTEEIRRKCRQTFYFDAKQAKQFGLVDRII